jgi:hypothetical protein
MPSPDTVVAGYSVAIDQAMPCATVRRAANAIGAAARRYAKVRRDNVKDGLAIAHYNQGTKL